MASGATLVIDIVVNAAKAQSELAATGGKFGKSMSQLAVPAAAAAAAIIAVGAASLKAASDNQQAMGGLDAVFGASADQMKAWAGTAAETTGMSSTQYAEATSKIGASLKNLGLPIDQAAKKSDELVRLGADLAATYGGSTTDAVDALGAALRGEADPAERYGLALSQTAVSAEMAKKGTDKLTGSAGKQAKAAAILSLATEQAGGAMGQFARESDSAAGASQIATAQWEDAKAALGTALLPAAAAAAGALGKLAKVLAANKDVVLPIVAVLGTLAAVILVVTAAQWAWNAAMLLSPVTWIVIAVIALVVAIILLWKKCDGFRNAVLAVWAAAKTAFNGIKTAVLAVVAAVRTAATAIKTFFIAAWRAIVAFVSGAVARIRAFIARISAASRSVAASVRATFSGAWASVKAYASSAASYVIAAIRRILAPVRATNAAIRAAFRSAMSSIRSAAASAASFVSSALRRPISAARSAASSIKSAFSSAFASLRHAASGIAGALSAPFRAVASAVRSAISAVQSLIGALSRIHVPKISIPKLGKSAAPGGVTTAGATTLSRSAYAGRTVSSRAAAGGPTIVVQGALDPDAVARQISRIIGSAERRRRGVTLSQRAAGPAAA